MQGITERFKDISKFPFSLPYISKPNEIPNEEYHNGEKYSAFISSSGLKLYLISPLWFKYAVENNEGGIGEEAEMVGNAYHDLLASYANTGSEEYFMSTVFEFDAPINQRTGNAYGFDTKAYQEAKLEALANNPGKMLVTDGVIKQVTNMTNHLLYGSKENSADIRTMIKYGKAEKSFFTEYEGAYFKFRTDLTTGKKIVDWKTIDTGKDKGLHEHTIRAQILKLKYDISAAMYQFLHKVITGHWKDFYWVFQQKSPPYDFVIVDSQPFTYTFAYELVGGKREKIVTNTGIGAMKFHALLDAHIHCVEDNYWPGAAVFIQEGDFGPLKGKRIMDCDIPSYEKKQLIFYH